MSYLRGPMTREEISRLMAGRVPPPPAAAPAEARAPAVSPATSSPPVAPAGLTASFLARYGGEIADPDLVVKYAVRYKGGDESLGMRAWPLEAASAAEIFDGEELALEESSLAQAPPARVRYAELPPYLADRGAPRGLEKAIKDRLPGELAATVWTDPVTGAVSRPGEEREAFAARLAEGAGPQAARLRERLEKKTMELEARQRDLEGRRTEKWVALGSAILSNVGLLTGRKRTISGAGTIASKNRMEGTAESRVDALKAEIADLEQQLAERTSVDAGRLQASTVVPTGTQVKLLRYGLVWVY